VGLNLRASAASAAITAGARRASEETLLGSLRVSRVAVSTPSRRCGEENGGEHEGVYCGQIVSSVGDSGEVSAEDCTWQGVHMVTPEQGSSPVEEESEETRARLAIEERSEAKRARLAVEEELEETQARLAVAPQEKDGLRRARVDGEGARAADQRAAAAHFAAAEAAAAEIASQAHRLVRVESALDALQADRARALAEAAELRKLLDHRVGADEEAEVARAVLGRERPLYPKP